MGPRIMHLIDQKFKITEADGAVHGIEHLLSVTMTNDNLQTFLCTWDTVLSGLQAPPESTIAGCIAVDRFEDAKPWNRTWHIAAG